MANVVTTLPSLGVFTVLPSAARTATPDTQEFELPSRANALHLVIDATAITSTPSITVTVSGVDRLSGKTYTLLAGAAVATVSTQILKVGPALTASANAVANDYLPPIIRISVAHGNANSITYSIGGLLCS
jgi:hypothetical protein